MRSSLETLGWIEPTLQPQQSSAELRKYRWEVSPHLYTGCHSLIIKTRHLFDIKRDIAHITFMTASKSTVVQVTLSLWYIVLKGSPLMLAITLTLGTHEGIVKGRMS